MTTTSITTAHEEEYSDKSRTIGILVNIDEKNVKIDSFVYTYSKGTYIIFNTIMDMNEYILYGDRKISRAYISEEDFDVFFGLFR